VRVVLKKMKRHKAPGLSGLVAEIIQAAGDTGTQWLLDLCNGIVKGLVAWHSGRTSVSGRRTFPVLRLTCS